MWFKDGSTRIYFEQDGSGEPLLLLPGFSVSIEDLRVVRQALTPRFRVIGADLPGSGRSQPQPRAYSPSYYQEDAKSFLSLLDEVGGSPAHVVGFSDGGEYALLMAELEPEAVRSIVTWGAAGSLAQPLDVVAMFASVVDSPVPSLKAYSDFLKANYGTDTARSMTQSAARAWEAIIGAGGDISRKRASEISCPALLLTGEHDFLASPAVVAEMAGAIPHGEFLEATGAGHSVHHDQPEWLVTTICDWLSRQP